MTQKSSRRGEENEENLQEVGNRSRLRKELSSHVQPIRNAFHCREKKHNVNQFTAPHSGEEWNLSFYRSIFPHSSIVVVEGLKLFSLPMPLSLFPSWVGQFLKLEFMMTASVACSNYFLCTSLFFLCCGSHIKSTNMLFYSSTFFFYSRTCSLLLRYSYFVYWNIIQHLPTMWSKI